MEHHTTATDPGVASAHCHGMTPTTMSSSSSSANGSSVSGNGRRRSSRKPRSLRHSVDIVVTRFKRILNPRPRKPSLNCRCDNDSIVEGQNGELSARPNAPYDVNAADASTAAACSKTPTSTSTSNSSSSRPSRQQQRQRSSSSSSSLHNHHNPHHHHHLCDTTSSSSFSTIRDNNNSSHNHSEQYRPRAFSVGMQLLRRISLNTKGHDQTTTTTPTTTTNGTATSPKLSGVSATSSITSVSLENVSDTNNNHHNSPDTDEFIINSRMQRVSEGEEDDHEDLSHDTTTTTIAAVDGVPCERQRASTLTASSHCYPSKVEEEEAASASSSDLMLSTSPVKHSFLRLNTDPIECATYGSTSDDNDNDNDNNEDSNDDTGYAPDDQGSSFSRDTDVYITSQIDSLSVTEDAIPTITTSTHFIEDLTTSSPTNHMKTSPTTINLISRDSILASSDDGEHYHQHGGSRPSSTNNGGIKRTQTPMFSTVSC
ncbi:hypothetical protein BDF22DRAFT_205383 [Syncephalis plumigaleata]|nr:hypothetical protein BDF22DRAFT_205383 [Syncephalis plumigaleata]